MIGPMGPHLSSDEVASYWAGLTQPHASLIADLMGMAKHQETSASSALAMGVRIPEEALVLIQQNIHTVNLMRAKLLVSMSN